MQLIKSEVNYMSGLLRGFGIEATCGNKGYVHVDVLDRNGLTKERFLYKEDSVQKGFRRALNELANELGVELETYIYQGYEFTLDNVEGRFSVTWWDNENSLSDFLNGKKSYVKTRLKKWVDQRIAKEEKAKEVVKPQKTLDLTLRIINQGQGINPFMYVILQGGMVIDRKHGFESENQAKTAGYEQMGKIL